MKLEDLRNYLISRSGMPLKKDEGILFGDPNIEIERILVTWMATLEAIKEAKKNSCNCILCHEALFYPYIVPEGIGDTLSWKVNRRRLELLAQNNIAVFRAHGTLDYLLVTEYFGKACKLGEPIIRDGIAYIYEIEHITLKKFAENVRASLGLTHLRIVGNPENNVSRIGIAVGGMGLSVNISFWETLLKHNVDTVLTGETDEYAIRYALDSGISVVETTHPDSENPGLKHFTKELERDFPGITIYFYDVGNKWVYIS